MSDGWSVGRIDGPSVTSFFRPTTSDACRVYGLVICKGAIWKWKNSFRLATATFYGFFQALNLLVIIHHSHAQTGCTVGRADIDLFWEFHIPSNGDSCRKIYKKYSTNYFSSNYKTHLRKRVWKLALVLRGKTQWKLPFYVFYLYLFFLDSKTFSHGI